MEMHLTLLQRKLPGEDAVVIPDPDVPEPEPTAPLLWMSLEGVRLLELRYLGKIYPNIELNEHYRALFAILRRANYNACRDFYDPEHCLEGKNKGRFLEWRLTDPDNPEAIVPYVVPVLEQFDLESNKPMRSDYFATKEMRRAMGKSTALEEMQIYDPETSVACIEGQFERQWLLGGEAYGILREMKAKVIETIQSDPNLTIQAQMLDLDWWAYRDQLFGAKGIPELGKEFQAVCTEAVRPEEAQEGESDVF
jgi:hypothetical protein